MLESAIGGPSAPSWRRSHFTYPGDIFPSSYFYENDIGKPEITLSGRGEVTTSQVPASRKSPIPTC